MWFSGLERGMESHMRNKKLLFCGKYLHFLATFIASSSNKIIVRMTAIGWWLRVYHVKVSCFTFPKFDLCWYKGCSTHRKFKAHIWWRIESRTLLVKVWCRDGISVGQVGQVPWMKILGCHISHMWEINVVSLKHYKLQMKWENKVYMLLFVCRFTVSLCSHKLWECYHWMAITWLYMDYGPLLIGLWFLS